MKKTKPRGPKTAKKKPAKAKPAAKKKSKAPRHDTPVDMPAVSPERPRPYSVTALSKPSSASLIDRLNAGETVQPTGAAGKDALARLSIIETLEEAYDAWGELREEHAAVRARYVEERARLEREGAFLLGAVKAAGYAGAGPSTAALAQRDGLSKLVAEAEEKLSRARAALEDEIAAQEQAYARAFERVKAEIAARVKRYAEGVKLNLKLYIRPLGATRNILHLDRLSPDEAILLLHSLHGAIPTRHGFLFDDSTDDVSQPPPPLYADEGIGEKQTRPGAVELRARMEAGKTALPLKGFIPVFVPNPAGKPDFFRLLQRGAVMEVEVQEGDSFRNMLSRDEAERFAGHMLRLKLSGKAELEIAAE